MVDRPSDGHACEWSAGPIMAGPGRESRRPAPAARHSLRPSSSKTETRYPSLLLGLVNVSGTNPAQADAQQQPTANCHTKVGNCLIRLPSRRRLEPRRVSRIRPDTGRGQQHPRERLRPGPPHSCSQHMNPSDPPAPLSSCRPLMEPPLGGGG